MNGRIRSRRVAAALLAAGAVTGAALGLAFTRGDAKGSLSHGPAAVLARGSFKTVSWGTTGTATIVRDSSGRITLRFSRDFTTQRAPELYVHMGSRRMKLQRAWGAQTYTLSHANAQLLGATVQVFCEKCNKAWGAAKLRPLRHGAAA
ncbi:MAG TPA: hypothetical protein VFK71_04120 [Gaiellaceae bacterium]|nr:hypothetical protein [Gaiellaceae bacterium]